MNECKLLTTLFSIFLKMDNHREMPDFDWYDEVGTLLDQYGRDKYEQLIINWLGFSMEERAAFDEQKRFYWLRQPVKPGMPDGLVSMTEAAITTNPDWYHQVKDLQFTVAGKHPQPRSMEYAYFYTTPGRLLRGVIHSTSILRTPTVLTMIETFAINFPEATMDVVHVYEQLQRDETIDRMLQLRKLLHSYLQIWKIDQRLRRLMYRKNKRSFLDIKESSIATVGLDENHQLERAIGPYQLQLDILHYTPATILWRKNAQPLLTPSEEDVVAAAPMLTELRRIGRRIRKQFVDESIRIELFLITGRKFIYKDWWPAYILHPLTGTVGKRVIWQLSDKGQQVTAIWTSAGMRTVDGMPVHAIDDETIVQLWHPANSEHALVLQWQEYIIQQQIMQPFTQVFRAAYRVPATTPEYAFQEDTFAGHILDHRQWYFNHSGKNYNKRGWRYISYSQGISARSVTLQLGALSWPDHRSWKGCYLLGQLRFYTGPYNNESNIALVDVPKVLYSEKMRSIDQDVSDHSIGNWQEWKNKGDDRSRAYWWRFNMGELTESGQIRKTVLASILKQLPGNMIIEGNFLKVAGYKIHIGSANAFREDDNTLIEMNNDGKGAGLHNIFLPIERDHKLCVIVSRARQLLDK